jgi:hypothetical protein
MTIPSSAPPPAQPNRYHNPTVLVVAVIVGLAGPLAGLVSLAVDAALPLLVVTLGMLPVVLVVGIVMVASAKTVRVRSVGLGLVIGFGVGLLLTGGTCAVVLGQVGA